MYTRINETAFVDAFQDMGRERDFTVAARQALFEYYEEIEESMGSEIELDVIGICCDWSEMSAEEVMQEHGRDLPEVLEHRVNLDERGVFSASIFLHALGTQAEWITDYFAAERSLMIEDGVDAADLNAAIHNVTGKPVGSFIAVKSEDEAAEAVDDQFEELIDELREETTVIEVNDYGGETRYLIEAF